MLEEQKNNIVKIIKRKKKYLEENKDKLILQHKEYYENNKEKMKKKITCDCGSVIRFSDNSRHLKTVKHCQFIESQITKPEVDEV